MDSYSVFIEKTLRDAGSIVREGFGVKDPEIRKETHSNVVTRTDRASEASILAAIRSRYPKDSIIAEETGATRGETGVCWIVDPLDGTSNFAAGIPWFGLLLARMEQGNITHAGMYLPIQDDYFSAALGKGTTKNGVPVVLQTGKEMADLLCGFQADYTKDPIEHAKNMARFGLLVQEFRNVRMTNSCFDFSLWVAGSTGAVVGTCSKLWDIAAPSLLITEAGGTVTDISGLPIDWSITSDITTKNFTFLIGTPRIHTAVHSLFTTIA